MWVMFPNNKIGEDLYITGGTEKDNTLVCFIAQDSATSLPPLRWLWS